MNIYIIDTRPIRLLLRNHNCYVWMTRIFPAMGTIEGCFLSASPQESQWDTNVNRTLEDSTSLAY